MGQNGVQARRESSLLLLPLIRRRRSRFWQGMVILAIISVGIAPTQASIKLKDGSGWTTTCPRSRHQLASACSPTGRVFCILTISTQCNCSTATTSFRGGKVLGRDSSQKKTGKRSSSCETARRSSQKVVLQSIRLANAPCPSC
jgi:hypothetical protein